MRKAIAAVIKVKPSSTLDEWLNGPEGRTIETWDNFAMLHQAKWHYARLKDHEGKVVSVGAGPNPEAARADVWANLPDKRR